MSIQSEINRIAGAKSDIADAIEDKDVTVPSGTKLDGMANLIRQISGGSEKLNSTQAADAYDPTATYAVGDKRSYAGNVYSCISPISTPEAWDSTHWVQVDPIQDQIDDVRNTLTQLDADLDAEVATRQTYVRPNLLDNWYFGNPVNQRGQTSYSNAGYTIDRWKLTSGSVEVVSGGITLNGTLVQILETSIGQTVTVSALLSDGTMITPTYNDTTMTFTLTATGQTIKAVKLELGSGQTLAHQENGVLVLNEIPNYEEHLIRCKISTADPNDTYANDPVAFQSAINATQTTTTGNLTLADGITASSATYAVCGKVMQITLRFIGGASGSSWVPIASLPSGKRVPQQEWSYVIDFNNNYTPRPLRVDGSQISIYGPAEGSNFLGGITIVLQ